MQVTPFHGVSYIPSPSPQIIMTCIKTQEMRKFERDGLVGGVLRSPLVLVFLQPPASQANV